MALAPHEDTQSMIVNSWNEWDPLKDVIVGTVQGAADMGFEPALSAYFGKDDPGLGGLHCCTVDIRRDGKLKYYFPPGYRQAVAKARRRTQRVWPLSVLP